MVRLSIAEASAEISCCCCRLCGEGDEGPGDCGERSEEIKGDIYGVRTLATNDVCVYAEVSSLRSSPLLSPVLTRLRSLLLVADRLCSRLGLSLLRLSLYSGTSMKLTSGLEATGTDNPMDLSLPSSKGEVERVTWPTGPENLSTETRRGDEATRRGVSRARSEYS